MLRRFAMLVLLLATLGCATTQVAAPTATQETQGLPHSGVGLPEALDKQHIQLFRSIEEVLYQIALTCKVLLQ